MAITRLSDLITPELFTQLILVRTRELSRLIASGALVLDPQLSSLMQGGGLTFNVPGYNDLLNEVDRVGDDDPGNIAGVSKITQHNQVGVRMNRNFSWGSMDLNRALTGSDPMAAIVNLVGGYWARRLQAAFVATWMGVFNDNDAAPDATEHVQGDLTNDVSGIGFSDGVTNFTAVNFINSTLTMGDALDSLGMIMVHSFVYARMQTLNLIDFIPDARGEVSIPTYQGHAVIIDDGLPNPSAPAPATTGAGIFHSWIFRGGATTWGQATPKTPTEIERVPASGNGAGEEQLWSRVQWLIHPQGHRYDATPANGGPDNTATVNNLAHLDSWKRVWPERKQIGVARLITREF